MEKKSKRLSRKRKWLLGICLGLIVGAVSGCKTLGFYSQAIKGQYQLVTNERPIDKLQSDPKTPATLKARFDLLNELRSFADKQLKLPVDGHYHKYVDVHRQFVVWNVEAAPEFSLQPKSWWYPLLGSLEYRGYFSQRGATNYAASLRKSGCDVYIGGVTAYSTLGWFKDPVLNTFLFEPDADLAETIFHELGHQRVFARGDTDFNEAFATTVGEEGARRWLKGQTNSTMSNDYLAELQRTRQFVALVKEARQRLIALYGDEKTEEGKIRAARKKPAISPDELRRRKQQVIEDMRKEYATVKSKWGGNPEYDGWFARSINNAQLNSVAAYYDLVPGFEHLLAAQGGNLEAFYDAAERLSKEPKKERHELLMSMGQSDSKEQQLAKVK